MTLSTLIHLSQTLQARMADFRRLDREDIAAQLAKTIDMIQPAIVEMARRVV